MLRQPPLQVRGVTDVKPIVLRGMQQVDVKHRLYFYRDGRVRRSLLPGLTEATARGSSRSVHVAECAADAIGASCPASPDPSPSDWAGLPPAWPTAPASDRAL